MKRDLNPLKISLTFFLLSICLLSCSSMSKAPLYLSETKDITTLTTLGILPVTYDAKYEEPLDVSLSPLILRQTEKLLKAKGYEIRVLSTPIQSEEDNPDTLSMEPSAIAANAPSGVDGLVVIRVKSHFGIDITERKPDIMGPAISINAVARLISVENPEELWRDKALGRSYSESSFLRGTQFLVRLDQAVRSLVENLFFTLPAKNG